MHGLRAAPNCRAGAGGGDANRVIAAVPTHLDDRAKVPDDLQRVRCNFRVRMAFGGVYAVQARTHLLAVGPSVMRSGFGICV
jgi:hypothetical protein